MGSLDRVADKFVPALEVDGFFGETILPLGGVVDKVVIDFWHTFAGVGDKQIVHVSRASVNGDRLISSWCAFCAGFRYRSSAHWVEAKQMHIRRSSKSCRRRWPAHTSSPHQKLFGKR